MLRRPATVILLTEEDVNTHMERILLARSSLPVNIGALSLDDEDQKSVIRDDKADQIAPSSSNTMTASSSSSSTVAGMCPASNVFPASLMRVRGLTHHAIAANSVNPNGAVPTANAAAQLISTHFPQTALATQLSAGSSSPSRTELTIPLQEFLDHHILPSPTSKQGWSRASGVAGLCKAAEMAH
ncbi:hypothetical protein PDE_05045 [Penicillium oxalicum 114-2]|uniref:Uncharacterized protein n=1 Tax=Penicillium oxalicum (strain 114-2 / CGMCC 5302) TaxID=933388 RepID=S7ZHF4_PENO1|nr:hypothetical protein PDE_05045 [Penicillium oxalicum 114-2]